MTPECPTAIGTRVFYYAGLRFDAGMEADRVMPAVIARENEDDTVNLSVLSGNGEWSPRLSVPDRESADEQNHPRCWWTQQK